MAKKLVEWYQSGDFATASLKLRPPKPPQTRGEIEAKFQEQYCAVYEAGKLECAALLPCFTQFVSYVSLKDNSLSLAIMRVLPYL